GEVLKENLRRRADYGELQDADDEDQRRDGPERLGQLELQQGDHERPPLGQALEYRAPRPESSRGARSGQEVGLGSKSGDARLRVDSVDEPQLRGALEVGWLTTIRVVSSMRHLRFEIGGRGVRRATNP